MLRNAKYVEAKNVKVGSFCLAHHYGYMEEESTTTPHKSNKSCLNISIKFYPKT